MAKQTRNQAGPLPPVSVLAENDVSTSPGQVFWLPDHPSPPLPTLAGSGLAGVVPGYSGGTAPDSHRLPFWGPFGPPKAGIWYCVAVSGARYFFPGRRRMFQAGRGAGSQRWYSGLGLSILGEMLAVRLDEHDDSPVDDGMVVLHGASWSDYQRLLEMRGEVSVPRFAYSQGALQVMTPSRPHESLKSAIGQLVEVWCLENGIEFSAYGSWTLERKDDDCGIEPDECYVFGTVACPERPDLAIEVVWTSGGVNKLEI